MTVWTHEVPKTTSTGSSHRTNPPKGTAFANLTHIGERGELAVYVSRRNCYAWGKRGGVRFQWRGLAPSSGGRTGRDPNPSLRRIKRPNVTKIVDPTFILLSPAFRS